MVQWIFTALKRSLGKGNVFTPVCLFTGGSAHRMGLSTWGSASRGVCLRGGSTSGGSAYSGDLHPGGLHTWGSASRGSAYRGGVHPGRSATGVLHLRGGHLGVGRPPPPQTRKVGGTHPTGMLSCYIFSHSTK